MVVAACGQLLLVSTMLIAQEVNPRGIPPPQRNTPDYPDREADRDKARKANRVDVAPPDRRLILIQIKKDFQQLQVVNAELEQRLSSSGLLDYKYISEAAAKIKTLAERLDSNLVLGESESKESRPEYEVSEAVLRSSLLSLHDLVITFVENPIFRESGVFDIPETKKAKADMNGILVLSDQVKKIAKRLRKDAGR